MVRRICTFGEFLSTCKRNLNKMRTTTDEIEIGNRRGECFRQEEAKTRARMRAYKMNNFSCRIQ